MASSLFSNRQQTSIPQGQNNILSQVAQLKNFFKMASNPEQALMSMAQNNAQVREVMNMCNGQNPKDIFYQKCSQMGIDPNYILNMMK